MHPSSANGSEKIINGVFEPFLWEPEFFDQGKVNFFTEKLCNVRPESIEVLGGFPNGSKLSGAHGHSLFFALWILLGILIQAWIFGRGGRVILVWDPNVGKPVPYARHSLISLLRELEGGLLVFRHHGP
jgi:hypothetical protein